MKQFGLKPIGSEIIPLGKIDFIPSINEFIAGWIADIPNGRGMYIFGETGSGKTTLAIVLANEWNRQYHIDRKVRYDLASDDDKLRCYSSDVAAGEILFFDRVYAVDWYKLVTAYTTLYENRTSDQHTLVYNCEHAVGNYQERILWILDDFAGSQMTPYILTCTETFIRYLHNQSATVIITSNTPMDDARKTWNDQVRSRLTEMCVQVNLTGKDRRGK